MKTISPQEFAQNYGEESLGFFSQPLPEKPGFLQRAGNAIKQGAQGVNEAITGQGQFANRSTLGKSFGAVASAFNTVPKVGYEALPEPARKGLSAVGKEVEKGFTKVADSLAETDLIKGAAMSGETQGLEDVLGVASSAGQISGDILLADQTAKVAQAVPKVAKNAAGKIQDLSSKVMDSVRNRVSDAPAKIMQRVARISKGKQAAFEQMSGESVGEYLTKRGIYGNVDDISEQLYKRFIQSKGTADKALEGLKGTFDPAPVKTALKELYERELRVSSPGAPSPILNQVESLMTKADKGGWNMSEINQIKRLFEKNVKVDYLKQNLPEAVARANNIDSSIRNWQFKQAETLGLKNLPSINKETQLAKQLLNELGKEYAGSQGNNAISLTDWVMLSGGDPTAISGFLVKKTFSSKGVQSAIAKALNKGKPTMGSVKADVGPTQVRELPAPTVNPRYKADYTPIKLRAPYGSEASVPRGAVTPSRPQVLQLPGKVLKLPSANNTTSSSGLSKEITDNVLNHLTSAEQILKETPGISIKELLVHTKKNIVDAAKFEGWQRGFDVVSRIDPNKFTTLEAFKKAVINALSK